MMPGRGYEVSGQERLDEIAYRFYGDPGLWRLIARANNIADPLRLQPGQVIWIPAAPGRRQP
ncbi:MAG: LysM peptidoglycan-binding domain-containing protein [Dehalococcoidia bacterium]|nr:LysM peptidoglycan-binding domain-containing protein [Dehalococcoidia bacterium]